MTDETLDDLFKEDSNEKTKNKEPPPQITKPFEGDESVTPKPSYFGKPNNETEQQTIETTPIVTSIECPPIETLSIDNPDPNPGLTVKPTITIDDCSDVNFIINKKIKKLTIKY